MSLDLDDRQRAMLQEMGVRVWWPLAEAPVVRVAEEMPAPPPLQRVAQAPQGPVLEVPHIAIENIALSALSAKSAAPKVVNIASSAREAVAPGVLADGIAAMDWVTLAHTVASCQACKLSIGRRAPVFGGADVFADAPCQADWLVLGEPPDEAEERAGVPFADQAGQLLDNMLKAVGVHRRAAQPAEGAINGTAAAYVSNVVKCRPASVRNPEPHELATCETYLKREVALVQPKVILAMGRFAAQSLLQGSLPEVASIPLGKLRGQIYHYQGIPVVVTYHPRNLLRTPQDKARAWADLCLALEQSKKK